MTRSQAAILKTCLSGDGLSQSSSSVTLDKPLDNGGTAYFTPLSDKEQISESKRKARLMPCRGKAKAELASYLLDLLNDGTVHAWSSNAPKAMLTTRKEADSECYTHWDGLEEVERWDGVWDELQEVRE